MSDFSYIRGRLVFQSNEDGEWYYEDGTPIDFANDFCPRCGKKPSEKEHDACLANLPGVKAACCGHGVEEGYIMFEDGRTIRGVFRVENY